jgi:hypothetical protein
MTPARNKPTDGAMRAAKQIEHNPSFLQSTAEIIDRETGVRELTDILENIITEAGDLIESRSPKLRNDIKSDHALCQRRLLANCGDTPGIRSVADESSNFDPIGAWQEDPCVGSWKGNCVPSSMRWEI